MNEDNVSVDNNLIDENEDEDELLEDEHEHEEGDEDEEDDESCNDNGVLQTPQEQVSLTKQYGSPRNKRLDIPLKFFDFFSLIFNNPPQVIIRCQIFPIFLQTISKITF